MEGSCSTGQSPQWAVVPVEEEEEEEEVYSHFIIQIGLYEKNKTRISYYIPQWQKFSYVETPTTATIVPANLLTWDDLL
jgi:hypothetical protein